MPTEKSFEQLFRDLLFADDTALVAHIERALQHLISCFAKAAQFFELEVSLKTEVLHQPAPLEEYRPPQITIGGTELKAAHQFPYLEGTITSDAKINREVDNSLAIINFIQYKKHLSCFLNSPIA